MTITALSVLKLQTPICRSHTLPKARSGFAVSGLYNAQQKDGVELHSCNVLSANAVHPHPALAPALPFSTTQEISMLLPVLFNDAKEACLIISSHR